MKAAGAPGSCKALAVKHAVSEAVSAELVCWKAPLCKAVLSAKLLLLKLSCLESS